MSRGMSPFAARRGATDVSFASTCSSLGMPRHPSTFLSTRTSSEIGFPQHPQHLGDLPDQFRALNVDAKMKTRTFSDIGFSQPQCQPQAIGDLSKTCDNVTVKANDVEADSMSKPPGTFLVSSSCFAPPVANIHMMDPITVGFYLQQPAYQWSISSSAYSSSAARDEHNDRYRTPRRQKCEKGEQEPAKDVNWEQRQEDRMLAVSNLKATQEYIDNQDVHPRPKTPDPSERMTKRPWERGVAEWRGAWREIDAVRKLVKQEFHEKDIREAWQKAKDKMDSQLAHNQEAQLEEAIKILTKK